MQLALRQQCIEIFLADQHKAAKAEANVCGTSKPAVAPTPPAYATQGEGATGLEAELKAAVDLHDAYMDQLAECYVTYIAHLKGLPPSASPDLFNHLHDTYQQSVTPIRDAAQNCRTRMQQLSAAIAALGDEHAP